MIGRILGIVALSLGLVGCAKDTVIVHDSQNTSHRIDTAKTHMMQAFTGQPGQGYIVMCRVDTVDEYEIYFSSTVGACRHETVSFGVYSTAFSAPDIRLKLKSGEVVKIYEAVNDYGRPPVPGYYAAVAIRRGPYDIEFIEGEQPAYWIEPGKFNVLGRFEELTATRDRAAQAIGAGLVESFDYIDPEMIEAREAATVILSCAKEQFKTISRECTAAFKKDAPFFRTDT